MTDAIPYAVEDLTDAWLTRVLRSNGAIEAVRVVDRAIEVLPQQGAVATLYRIGLSYDGVASAAPSSLIAKCAATNDAMRKLANAVGIYRREAKFYGELADDAGISVPGCYFAGYDPDEGRFLLLLEDLAPSRTGSAAASRVQDVADAVDVLAAFHARWWRSRRLAELGWLLPADDPTLVQAQQDRLGRAVSEVRRRFPDAFAPALAEVAHRLATNYSPAASMLASSPQTLVHGDFHTQNLFFPSRAGGRFAVVDWQMLARRAGPIDLACLLSFSLSPQDRRSVESALVEQYHRTLMGAGVRDYSLVECWRDYRLGIVPRVLTHVMGIAVWDERAAAQYEGTGVTFTDVMLTRLDAFIEDHDVLSLLDRPVRG